MNAIAITYGVADPCLHRTDCPHIPPQNPHGDPKYLHAPTFREVHTAAVCKRCAKRDATEAETS
jgi:hypothetical protein